MNNDLVVNQVVVPSVLAKYDLGYVKLKKEAKIPYEKDWQNTHYTYNQIKDHVEKGNNYGVLCGYKDLVVVDADSDKVTDIVKRELPKTLTVKTGGGYHFYYFCSGLNKKVVLRKDGVHLGEIISKGGQVVGAGAIHPNGTVYSLLKDTPISHITLNKLIEPMNNFIGPNKVGTNINNRSKTVNKKDVSLLEMLEERGVQLKPEGNELSCSHPIHGSENGNNLKINPSKNVWHCHRCGTGGDWISMLAVLEGVINCSEGRSGGLQGKEYIDTMAIAKEKYGIELEPKEDCSESLESLEKEKNDCLYGVAKALTVKKGNPKEREIRRAVSVCQDWLLKNGARFYKTGSGEPYVYFGRRIYWVDSTSRIRKRAWNALVLRLTGLTPSKPLGKAFMDVFASETFTKGKKLDPLKYLHTDILNHTIYFNLNNEDNEIVKITPEGVEVLINGENKDGIFLEPSPNMVPLKFNPEVEVSKGIVELKSKVFNQMSCKPGGKSLAFNWFSAFLLKDFSSTIPILHFTGGTSSGKTTATKLISTLLFGKEQQKVSTVAANYAEAVRQPAMFLDDIETGNATPPFIKYLLVSTSGITNEKRTLGTDGDVTQERVKCMNVITGIEPLCPEMPEIVNRVMTIPFSEDGRKKGFFDEVHILETIKHSRNDMLSTIMKMTTKALEDIKDGGLSIIIETLSKIVGGKSHNRCYPFLALSHLASGEDDLGDTPFLDQVKESIERSVRERKEADPINGMIYKIVSVRKSVSFDTFKEKYAITFDLDMARSEWLKAYGLLVLMRRVAKESNMPFPIKNASQLGTRLRAYFNGSSKGDILLERKWDTDAKSFSYRILSSKGIKLVEDASERTGTNRTAF